LAVSSELMTSAAAPSLLLVEGGTELAQALGRRAGPDALVSVERERVALSRLDLDPDHLPLEFALFGRLGGAPVGLRGVLVLRLPRDGQLLGDDLAGVAHVEVVVRVPQAVVHHHVHELAVPQTESVPRSRDVVRRVRHGLHAARDHHLLVAQADRLRGEHRRLHP